jgi:hypothetical protein
VLLREATQLAIESLKNKDPPTVIQAEQAEEIQKNNFERFEFSKEGRQKAADSPGNSKLLWMIVLYPHLHVNQLIQIVP